MFAGAFRAKANATFALAVGPQSRNTLRVHIVCSVFHRCCRRGRTATGQASALALARQHAQRAVGDQGAPAASQQRENAPQSEQSDESAREVRQRLPEPHRAFWGHERIGFAYGLPAGAVAGGRNQPEILAGEGGGEGRASRGRRNFFRDTLKPEISDSVTMDFEHAEGNPGETLEP